MQRSKALGATTALLRSGGRTGGGKAAAGPWRLREDLASLGEMAVEKRLARNNLEEYDLGDGRSLFVAAEGRLVNLGAAEGHPADVMDMSFSNQALAAEWLVANEDTLPPQIYTLPREVDEEVARIKLQHLGAGLEQLTEDQIQYLSSWEEGTS